MVPSLSKTARYLFSTRVWFSLLSLASIVYLLVFVILDYNKTWTLPEVPIKFLNFVFSSGTAVGWDDLYRSFEWETMSEGARVRFLSSFVLALNAKLRVWLWNWVPPHPSFSFVWFFNLLSLYFLYRLVSMWSGSKKAAWAVVLLYSVSCGYLSFFSLLFHPAKPLAAFFTIFCLYLAALIDQKVKENKVFSPREWRLFWGLLLAMGVATYADESALFISITLPILFPSLFVTMKHRKLIWTLFSLPLVLYVAMVTWGAPFLWREMGFGDNSVWKEFTSEEANHNFVNYHAIWIFKNLWNLTKDHFYHFGPSWMKALGAGLFFLYLSILFLKSASKRQFLVLQSLFVLLVFNLLLSLLHSKHLQIIGDAFYYGTIWGLFWCLCLGVWLASSPKGFAIANNIVLALFMGFFIMKFQIARDRQIVVYDRDRIIRGHVKKKIPVPIGIERMRDELPYTYQKNLTLWRHRGNPRTIDKMYEQLPGYAYPVIYELNLTKLGALSLLKFRNWQSVNNSVRQ